MTEKELETVKDQLRHMRKQMTNADLKTLQHFLVEHRPTLLQAIVFEPRAGNAGQIALLQAIDVKTAGEDSKSNNKKGNERSSTSNVIEISTADAIRSKQTPFQRFKTFISSIRHRVPIFMILLMLFLALNPKYSYLLDSGGAPYLLDSGGAPYLLDSGGAPTTRVVWGQVPSAASQTGPISRISTTAPRNTPAMWTDTGRRFDPLDSIDNPRTGVGNLNLIPVDTGGNAGGNQPQTPVPGEDNSDASSVQTTISSNNEINPAQVNTNPGDGTQPTAQDLINPTINPTNGDQVFSKGMDAKRLFRWSRPEGHIRSPGQRISTSSPEQGVVPNSNDLDILEEVQRIKNLPTMSSPIRAPVQRNSPSSAPRAGYVWKGITPSPRF